MCLEGREFLPCVRAGRLAVGAIEHEAAISPTDFLLRIMRRMNA